MGDEESLLPAKLKEELLTRLSARKRNAREFSLITALTTSCKSAAKLPVVVCPGSDGGAQPAGVGGLPVPLHPERGSLLAAHQEERELMPLPQEELPEGRGAQVSPRLRQALHPDADVRSVHSGRGNAAQPEWYKHTYKNT